MNMHARDIAARNHRLGKDAKPEPVVKRRPLFSWVRPDQNEHVKAWEAHKVMCDDYALVSDYIKATCFVQGIAEEELYRKRGGKKRVEARYRVIRVVAARYPRLSSARLGRIFQKDHTVILYALRRLGMGSKPRKAKLSPQQVREIRQRAAARKEMSKDIAASFGVCPSYVSAIVSGRRMRGVGL